MTALLLSAMLAVAPSTAPAPPAHTVRIAGFRFVPATITIRSGESITFVNDDTEPHTATSATFDSGGLDLHDRWTHAFTVPGTFAYACSLHPQMTGRIVVRPAAAP